MSGESNQVVWRGVRPVEGIRGIWPARNAVRINEDAEAVGVSSITIYTVPANKILFISTVDMASIQSSIAAVSVRLNVFNELAAFSYRIKYHYFEAVGQQVSSSRYVPALEAAAGYTIRIFSAHADGQAAACLHGWLEDA